MKWDANNAYSLVPVGTGGIAAKEVVVSCTMAVTCAFRVNTKRIRGVLITTYTCSPGIETVVNSVAHFQPCI